MCWSLFLASSFCQSRYKFSNGKAWKKKYSLFKSSEFISAVFKNIIWAFYSIMPMQCILLLESTNFSCRFLNPNYFFYFQSNGSDMRNLKEQVEKAFCFKKCTYISLFIQIVLVIFDFCKFLAISFKFQKVFSITRTHFSDGRPEQFWKQNTIYVNSTRLNRNSY